MAAAERGWIDERQATLEIADVDPTGGGGPRDHVSRQESRRVAELTPRRPVRDRSDKLLADARALMPGGVSSPGALVRRGRSANRSSLPSASGAEITDVDGNSYIDLVQSWGALLFGHAHPEIVDAVAEAAAKGTSFGTPSELEVELARLVTEMVPNVERIRFVSSGTEASMTAVRLARGCTGRDKIVKFAGCYHGHADASAGRRRFWGGDARHPRHPRGHRRRDGRHACRSVQRPRCCTGGARRSRRRPCRDPRRTGRREHGPRPARGRFPRRSADRSRRDRGAARLRRGHHRLPSRPRRRAGAIRDRRRPRAARQDPRRRPSGRGSWGPRRSNGPPRSRRAGLSSGHAVGEPRRDGSRDRHADARSRPTPASTTASRTRPAPLSEVSSMRPSRTRCRWSRLRSVDWPASSSATTRSTNYDASTRDRSRSLCRASSAGMLAHGIYLPPSRFEALFLSTAHTEAHVDHIADAAARVFATP